MTAHAHGPSMNPVDDAVDAPTGATSAGGTSTRPRWLLPGIAVGVVVAGLVVAGVVSLSTALSGGLFAGMLLMHVGGHGMHGGHGGGGHGGHGGQDERTTDARTRGEGAPGASRRSDLAPTPEGAASDAPRGERYDDARRDSHAGH
jgi:hypothetical protein